MTIWYCRTAYRLEDPEFATTLRVGSTIGFLCNGRGRGGHYSVTARVVKINPKTVDAVEMLRSYHPGTNWRVAKSEFVVIPGFHEEELLHDPSLLQNQSRSMPL